MDYYIYLILDILYKWRFELFFISIGLALLAWMDFITFQRPKDSGYFSLHTKGSKRDAWHDAKRLCIFSFAIAAIGEPQVAWLLANPFVWVAFLAFFIQWFGYHIILKTVYRIILWINVKLKRSK